MLLPAVAASFWAREVWSMTAIAVPIAFLSGPSGFCSRSMQVCPRAR
jgi:zinc/manganese transport system permease protein